MKISNVIKSIVIFATGFVAGAYYVSTQMRDYYQQYADAQIEDVKQAFAEKEARMDSDIETKANKKAVDIAMQSMNLQTEDGRSVYETSTHTYELLEPDRFGEIDEFETSFLTYFKDGILAYDIGGHVVDEPNRVVGPDAIDNIGKYSPDLIHVRNHLYRKDYEILRSAETYAEHYGHEPGEEDDE